MIPIGLSLFLGAALFAIGLTGVLIRRNVIILIMCIELIVNAANLNLVAFSAHHGLITGRALVLFVIGIEAAELAVALGLITAYFRLRGSVNIDTATLLKD